MRDEGREHVMPSWSTTQVLEELQARQARLEQLLEITHELARSQAREELLLQRIAERGRQILGADALGVLLLSGDRFVVRAAVGDAGELFGDAGPARARSAAGTATQTGAAVVIPDAELTAETLGRAVGELLGDPARLEAMARASAALARPDAARDVAREVLAQVR